MHIAFLNPQGNFDPNDRYWTEHPDFGGQLVYVKEVAAALAREGHKVDILTRQIIDPDWPEFAGKEDSYPGIDGLRILRIPCGPEKFLTKESLWSCLGADWVPNIIAHYKQEDALPDIFTSHYGDGGLAGVLLSQQTDIPFTFTGHSLGAQKMDKLGISKDNLAAMLEQYKFQYRIQAERLSMNYASRIFTSTRQEQLEQYGHHAYRGAVDSTNSKRFAVVPPGVNLSIFTPQPQALDDKIRTRMDNALASQIPAYRHSLPIVLAASRLDKKKNHLGVVQAFAANPELKDSANLALVVRGLQDPLHDYASLSVSEKSVMDEITQEIADNNLEDCVFAFSLDSQLELAAAYRILSGQQSCFILSALYEPFGLAPLEAMSCGLPAVVTKNGGPSESMFENGQEYGVLIDPADPADIAAGILRLISTKETWEKFHQAGMQRVMDKYTWERTAQGYNRVFNEIKSGKDSAEKSLSIPDYFIHYTPENQDAIADLKEIYFQN
ncbi:glycosyltransferase [bacterium]|nr:glycosyltransferase [bacterium]